MKNNSPIFAKPPSDNISLGDCEFYHVMDIPGLSEPPKGKWDLRKGVDKYLGHVDFKNKTVLELGPASGFLTFHIEKMGGDVTSVDLDHQKYKWDIKPIVRDNWQEELKVLSKEVAMLRNSYWYAHKAFNSKSKLIHSHVNDLPAEIGIYDISLMCSVILHLQNPFLGIQNMLRHTKEKAIITDMGSFKRIKSFRNIIRNLKKYFKQLITPRLPIIEFYPKVKNEHHDIITWWKISPEFIVNVANILGFETSSINYHVQYFNGHPLDVFTVVCERTVPIENCNYD